MEPKDRLVFPLDVATAEEAMGLVDRLEGRVGVFKIGMELFYAAGPEIVRSLRQKSNARIFLDLKLHDIPETVGRAMRAVVRLGADFVTVHCGETTRMLEAAVAAAGGKAGVLCVTVLTSVGGADLATAGFRMTYAEDVLRLVMKRAEMAAAAGCAGVVCSGREVGRIKARFGGRLRTFTPGIRPAWSMPGGDDQCRTVTPAAAVAAGADYLVIGRPIRDADDPAAAAERIAAEIGDAEATQRQRGTGRLPENGA